MIDEDAMRAEVFRALRLENLTVESIDASTESFRVTSLQFHVDAVLQLPRGMLREYVEAMAARYEDVQDPAAEAMSLAQMHFVEELTTDHGRGQNRVRSLGLSRDSSGRVTLYANVDRLSFEAPGSPSDSFEWRADR